MNRRDGGVMRLIAAAMDEGIVKVTIYGCDSARAREQRLDRAVIKAAQFAYGKDYKNKLVRLIYERKGSFERRLFRGLVIAAMDDAPPRV